MKGDTRSSQASQIMHVLAELPGSTAINVTARKFPRFGPHATGTIYEEKTFSFPVNQLPETLDVPQDAEEVRITLLGALQSDAPTDLMGQLNDYFAESGMAETWGVRGRIHPPQEAQTRRYEVQVFM